jgi:SsrA-binding protein
LAWNHDPRRDRKLLAHRREIRRLEVYTRERGVTLVPLAIYFKKGLAKVEIGVGKGKREYDKRESIRRKEQDRQIKRMMSRRQSR